ncbi:conjugal transfer protein TraI [Pontibacter sp. 13R65]|uniref:conjugal transfer protein TraI n=1 Tax=Pontibacter sp. 13R65 TaxID=3127458 RepID=UPI00301DCD0C
MIVALDLQVQHLQNQTIWLQNAQKVLENKLSELRLTEIALWTERQRQLYADYFEELRQVKAAITYYQRVRDIIGTQAALVAEYKRSYQLFRQDDNFSVQELEYMEQVCAGILEASVENLDQVLLLVSPHATQMSDAARLELIQQAADRLEQNYSDLREFNAQNVQLSLQRAKERHNLQTVQKLYGLP